MCSQKRCIPFVYVIWLILCMQQVSTLSTCVNSYGPEFCALDDACSLTDSGCDARCNSIGCNLDCFMFANSNGSFYNIDFLNGTFYGYEFEMSEETDIGRLGLEISGLDSSSLITVEIQNAEDDGRQCSGTDIAGDNSDKTMFLFSEFTQCTLIVGAYRAIFRILGVKYVPTIRYQKIVSITTPSIMTNVVAIYGSWSTQTYPTVFYTDYRAVRIQICTTDGVAKSMPPTPSPSFLDLNLIEAKCATGTYGTAIAKEKQICTFPFLLYGEWKYGCQNTNLFSNNGWCSTTIDFDTDGLWGECIDCSETDTPLGGNPGNSGTCVEGDVNDADLGGVCYRDLIWDCMGNGCNSNTPCFEPVSGSCSEIDTDLGETCADAGLLSCDESEICGVLQTTLTGGELDRNVYFQHRKRLFYTYTEYKPCGFGYNGKISRSCSSNKAPFSNTLTDDCTAQSNPGGFTDNFEGTVVDESKWTVLQNDNTWLTGAGQIAFSGPEQENFILSADQYKLPLVIRTRIWVNSSSYGHFIMIGSKESSFSIYALEEPELIVMYQSYPDASTNAFWLTSEDMQDKEINTVVQCDTIFGWFNMEMMLTENEAIFRIEADDCSKEITIDDYIDNNKKESQYIYVGSTCADFVCKAAYFDYVSVQTVYSSCLDWRNDGFITDGLYTLNLGKYYTPFDVYCFGMNTLTPLEYLEVDRSTTFSEFCDSNDEIAKVEYDKVRLVLSNSDFTLDRDDFGFTNFYVRDEISSYNILGRAKTCTVNCTARFSIDLSASGFYMASSNQVRKDDSITLTDEGPDTMVAYAYSCQNSVSSCEGCWFDDDIVLETYGYSGNVDPLDDAVCDSSLLDVISSIGACSDVVSAINSGSDDNVGALTDSQLCTCTNQISNAVAGGFNGCKLSVSMTETFYGQVIKCRAVNFDSIGRRRIGIEDYIGDGRTCQLPNSIVGKYYWLYASSTTETACSVVVDNTDYLTGYMYIYMGYLSGTCYVYSHATTYEGKLSDGNGEILADYSSKFKCGIYVASDTCYDILGDDTCTAISQNDLCDSQGDNCPITCSRGCAATPANLSTSTLACTEFNSSLELFNNSVSYNDMLLEPVVANVYGASFTPNLGMSLHVTSVAIRVQGSGDITSFIWGPASFDDCTADTGGSYCQGNAVASDASGAWVESAMSGDPPKLLDGETYTIAFEMSALASLDDTYLVTLPQSLSDNSGVSDLITSAEPNQPLTYVPVMKVCYYGFTSAPSFSPTEPPTKNPTQTPTMSPTNSPSTYPTTSPTSTPTTSPTPAPTQSPTSQPTPSPTLTPTASPTQFPTTAAPSDGPTAVPTPAPQIPGDIEYIPQILSFSKTKGFDVYHYIFFCAAIVIFTGICCSFTPCCWSVGLDSEEKRKKAINDKLKDYKDIVKSTDEEMKTWQSSSKLFVPSKTAGRANSGTNKKADSATNNSLAKSTTLEQKFTPTSSSNQCVSHEEYNPQNMKSGRGHHGEHNVEDNSQIETYTL